MLTKNDNLFFKRMRRIFTKNAMWEVTPETLKKIWEESGLIPPDSERVVDVKDRVSFVCYVRNYIVWVHTSFNRRTGTFTKKAALSMVISKMVNRGEKRIMTRFIQRDTDGVFVERLDEYVTYILKELRENWPLAKGAWARVKEFPDDQFFWVYKNGKKIRNFFGNAEALYCMVEETEARRLYYHKVRRKVLGVKRYRRDIRKPYRHRRKRK